jgi:hypothetical protein
MLETTHVQAERVSVSAIKSVYGQLKSNGYSHGQIIALSRGLSEMAQDEPPAGPAADPIPWQAMSFEYDLSLLGL